MIFFPGDYPPTAGRGASCPWMDMNSLEKIAAVLRSGGEAIHVDPVLGRRAMKPLQRMLDFRANLV